MNAPLVDRAMLKRQSDRIAAAFPLTILGIAPEGTVRHVEAEWPLELIAEAGPGATYFDVGRAEEALSAALGCPVGIRLLSELNETRRAALLGRMYAL